MPTYDAAKGRLIPLQWPVATLLFCLILVVAGPATAYYDEYVAPISEIPLTSPTIVGAR